MVPGREEFAKYSALIGVFKAGGALGRHPALRRHLHGAFTVPPDGIRFRLISGCPRVILRSQLLGLRTNKHGKDSANGSALYYVFTLEFQREKFSDGD